MPLPHLPSTTKRRAFSLVELLVAIAMIGMLVALLLPAVQAARESGRRTQCANHLKQLLLAVHGYHDSYRAFPSAYLSDRSIPGRNFDPATLDSGPGFAWGSLILPQIEQGGLYESIDWKADCWDPRNASSAASRIPTFLCPSASGDTKAIAVTAGGISAKFSRSHYVTNVGREAPWGFTIDDYTNVADGPFFRNSAIRAADVTDGLSQTVFLGEHHSVVSDKTWYGVLPGAQTCPKPRFAFEACDAAAPLVHVHSGPSKTESPPVIHVPNSPLAHIDEMYAEHPGGCNIALGDGSVRFVSERIEPVTWSLLSSRNDGEPTGAY